jgi:hypothetical protein
VVHEQLHSLFNLELLSLNFCDYVHLFRLLFVSPWGGLPTGGLFSNLCGLNRREVTLKFLSHQKISLLYQHFMSE